MELKTDSKTPRLLSGKYVAIKDALRHLSDIADQKHSSQGLSLGDVVLTLKDHLDKGKPLETPQRNAALRSLVAIGDLLTKGDEPLFPSGSGLAQGWLGIVRDLARRLDPLMSTRPTSELTSEKLQESPSSHASDWNLRAPSKEAPLVDVHRVGYGSLTVDYGASTLTIAVEPYSGTVRSVLRAIGLRGPKTIQSMVLRLQPGPDEPTKVSIGTLNRAHDDRMVAVFHKGEWLIQGFAGGTVTTYSVSARGVHYEDLSREIRVSRWNDFRAQVLAFRDSVMPFPPEQPYHGTIDLES